MALLDVQDLSLGYQTRNGFLQAVEGVSFSLEKGKSLGFVGESGCGKTTIGMALIGLLPKNARVTGGRILFRDKDLLTLSTEELRKLRWQEIAMIFQAAMNAMNPVQRVSAQIVEAILTHAPEIDKETAAKQVAELFDQVGIPRDRMHNYPHQYSGGMKQRAVIAMALACRPSLVIADEPTTALDVIVQDQILKEIKRLQRDLDLSMIFISHDIAVVAEVCHNIGVMYAGQLVEYGSREEVFHSPIHPYTRALLASYLTIDGDTAKSAPLKGDTPNLIQPPEGCRFCDRCDIATSVCKVERPAWVSLSSTHRALCCGIRKRD